MFSANQARNGLQAATDHVFTLRLVLTFLVLIIAALGWRNAELRQMQRLYIPPDLTQGLVMNIDDVPAPTVYTFAYYIFQQLNRWKVDGEKDYPQQIYTLQAFLTPGCIASLTEAMNEKQQRGELRHRVRSVEEILGQGYQRNRVAIKSTSSWMIWLDVRVNESINGHPVKEVPLRYAIPVVRFDVDRAVNPWGLALACQDGFDAQPLDDKPQPFIPPAGESL